MPDWRRIATEARFILERHNREVDLVTSYLHEASVLVLVFGLLDTFATGRLDWTVAKFIVSIAFVLFAAALATPWMVYHCLRGILLQVWINRYIGWRVKSWLSRGRSR
jgi:hypothetical protein